MTHGHAAPASRQSTACILDTITIRTQRRTERWQPHYTLHQVPVSPPIGGRAGGTLRLPYAPCTVVTFRWGPRRQEVPAVQRSQAPESSACTSPTWVDIPTGYLRSPISLTQAPADLRHSVPIISRNYHLVSSRVHYTRVNMLCLRASTDPTSASAL